MQLEGKQDMHNVEVKQVKKGLTIVVAGVRKQYVYTFQTMTSGRIESYVSESIQRQYDIPIDPPDDPPPTEIHDKEFMSRIDILGVELEDNYVRIGKQAFFKCCNLSKIVICSNMRVIDDRAFKGCSNLKNIIFKGTILEWQQIYKGRWWDENTGNYTVTCLNGEIKKHRRTN